MKAYGSIRHHCWAAFAAFIGFLCVLIRDVPRMSAGFRRLCVVSMVLTAFGLGWLGGNTIWLRELKRDKPTGEASMDAMVERIISIESGGIPTRETNDLAERDLVNFSTKLGSI